MNQIVVYIHSTELRETQQHELETSARKVPWSAAKRQAHFEPNTPVKVGMSSQMRSWNAGNGAEAGIAATPRGPHFGAIERLPSQRPRQLAATEGHRKPTLPGFHNAFAESPLRPLSQKVFDKGKGKQVASLNDNPFLVAHARSSPPSSPLGPNFELPSEDAMDVVPTAAPSNQSPVSSTSPLPAAVLELRHDEDVKMVNTSENAAQLENLDIDPPNWRDQVSGSSCG